MSKMKFSAFALAFAFAVAVSGGLFVAGASPAFAADAKKGGKVFKKCKACHSLKDDKKKKIGPHLSGIIGRGAGSVEGFKYSDALKNSGITWDEATLDEWLTSPKKMVPGTKMVFPGLKKESQRANVIIFLVEETK